ncbi:uncharacterized protein EV420DRAFT_1748470 [Desarmillaria tabescens]|uniref:Fork-head domain-containing protein n=1 Tax=Armillaria tabescens TaxID=1929756 RepID=A0AA39KFA8_ARMTA|nr:uncharacterized protein EV420DRAFT_1748470 [Desarmillaria tabescens]KAK0457723.1 hypothetical protein EV420DRAFT_1748470 [Desarmillaria tabescens]
MDLILARQGFSTTLHQILSKRVHLPGVENTKKDLEGSPDKVDVYAGMNNPPSKYGPCLESRPSHHSSLHPNDESCAIGNISFGITAPIPGPEDRNKESITPLSDSVPSREKPDIPYVAIIKQAILSSPDRRLSLSEIYDWIITVYPFFSSTTTSWKNTIRHTLSSYQCFRNEAHGIWAIDDANLESYGNGSLQSSDSWSSKVDSVRKVSGTKQAGTITGSRKDDSSIPKSESRKREIDEETDKESRQSKKRKKARSRSYAAPDLVHEGSLIPSGKGKSLSSCPEFWRSSRNLRDDGRMTASNYGSDAREYRRPTLVPVKSWD